MNDNNTMFIISIISLVFGFIGVIGLVFTIISYRNQKKTENAYRNLLSQANKDWVGKYTSEEIEALNSQLAELTKQINMGIPLKAEKALLKAKEENLRNEIEALYKDYITIQKQLAKIEEPANLSPEIASYIKNEMEKKIGNKNIDRRILIFFACLLFLAIPFFNSIVYKMMHYVIYYTNANLTPELITFYIFAMIICCFIITSLKLNKITMWILNHKTLSIILTIICLLVWGIIVYLISYDVLIKGFAIQTIIGCLSVILFAISFDIIITILKVK